MVAVTTLVLLIAALTGIERDVDLSLTAIAERRVVEIQAEFSHAGADLCCAEVLAQNAGHLDPVAQAVEQWHGSADHWAILTDPAYGAIGCAVDVVGLTTYAVCILAAIQQPAPEPADPEPNSDGGAQPSSGAPSTSATPPPAPALPDTAIDAPEGDEDEA